MVQCVSKFAGNLISLDGKILVKVCRRAQILQINGVHFIVAFQILISGLNDINRKEMVNVSHTKKSHGKPMATVKIRFSTVCIFLSVSSSYLEQFMCV